MYGDIKTRDNRVRTSVSRRGGAGRIARFVFGGFGVFMLLDFTGFIAWGLSGQVPPESGYYFGRLTVELLKVII